MKKAAITVIFVPFLLAAIFSSVQAQSTACSYKEIAVHSLIGTNNVNYGSFRVYANCSHIYATVHARIAIHGEVVPTISRVSGKDIEDRRTFYASCTAQTFCSSPIMRTKGCFSATLSWVDNTGRQWFDALYQLPCYP